MRRVDVHGFTSNAVGSDHVDTDGILNHRRRHVYFTQSRLSCKLYHAFSTTTILFDDGGGSGGAAMANATATSTAATSTGGFDLRIANHQQQPDARGTADRLASRVLSFDSGSYGRQGQRQGQRKGQRHLR